MELNDQLLAKTVSAHRMSNLFFSAVEMVSKNDEMFGWTFNMGSGPDAGGRLNDGLVT